jgi:hypothetical protein
VTEELALSIWTPKEQAVNELLREHVTRVGFDLSLGHTHIAALVELDLSMKYKRHIRIPRGHRLSRAHSLFSHATSGLIERGLVIHHYNAKEAQRGMRDTSKDKGLAPHYTITAAGRMVIGLLKEAGIFDDYAQAFVVPEKSKSA